MTSWAHVKDEQNVEPKWAHVEEEPENRDQFCELCSEIDEAYEKYKQKKLYFGNFYTSRIDMKVAEYLFAISEMQKCMGDLSEMSCDIFKGDSVDPNRMERIMGKMFFYMEVAMMSHGKDLTDAKDECKRTCQAIMRL